LFGEESRVARGRGVGVRGLPPPEQPGYLA